MPSISTQESQRTLARAVARRLYGFRPTGAARLASENNFVYRIEFGGLPGKVIKLPGRGAGMLREQRIVRSLRRGRWHMPVPAIEFTQDDLPPFWESEGATWNRPAAVTIMRLERGMPLCDAVLRGEGWAGEAMREAGALAARLAEVPPMVLMSARRAQSTEQIERALGWVQPVVEAFAIQSCSPRLEIVVAAKQRTARSVVHGELCLENLFVEASAGGVQLCTLDWKAARPGSPLDDLAALLTSLAELPLGDAGQRAYLRRHAIDGFAALQPFDAEATRELAAWETLALLSVARVHLEAGRQQQAFALAALAANVAEQ